MNILGIETSCDETSAAVVRDGKDVLSNVVNSQVALHGPHGGVVPEIASRCHVECLPAVVDKALKDASLGWSGIDRIAVTYGPGLASSLLVGLSFAKGLAMRLDVPLCLINHIEAHIYSVFVGENTPEIVKSCPFLALVVSGGHTCLVRVSGVGKYKVIGQTIDDAAGEAFDKGANLLNMGYPGGPVIDRKSRDADRKFVRFPRGRLGDSSGVPKGMDPELCFSFSGLKTALMYYLKENPSGDNEHTRNSIAASYQEAVVDALIDRCGKALRGEKVLVAGGGVSLNSRLRERLKELAVERGVNLLLASPAMCGDNAAMIAGLAGAGGGIGGDGVLDMDVVPNLGL